MKLSTVLPISILLRCSRGAVLPKAETPCPYYRPDAELVEHGYIVVLREGHTLEKHFEQIGSDLSRDASRFHPITAINAYHARLDHDLVHQQIRFDPGVEFVEHDHKVQHHAPIEEGGYEELDPVPAKAGMVGAFLNRLGKLRPRDNWWHWQVVNRKKGAWYDAQKTFGKKTKSMWWWTSHDWQVLDGAGKGVDLYVLDTGIRLSHDDFQGRAINFRGEDTSPYVGRALATDFQGHGTHVAGIAAGVRGGMAPWANVVNVKIVCAPGEPVCDDADLGGVTQALSDITADVSNDFLFHDGIFCANPST
jgi:hypothetical protein